MICIGGMYIEENIWLNNWWKRGYKIAKLEDTFRSRKEIK